MTGHPTITWLTLAGLGGLSLGLHWALPLQGWAVQTPMGWQIRATGWRIMQMPAVWGLVGLGVLGGVLLAASLRHTPDAAAQTTKSAAAPRRPSSPLVPPAETWPELAQARQAVTEAQHWAAQAEQHWRTWAATQVAQAQAHVTEARAQAAAAERRRHNAAATAERRRRKLARLAERSHTA